ncbi:MAG: hypothetical protein ACREUI_08510 [Burkholderiales bacterium]
MQTITIKDFGQIRIPDGASREEIEARVMAAKAAAGFSSPSDLAQSPAGITREMSSAEEPGALSQAASYAKNFMRGGSFRGKEAFTALNPFATSEDKLQVERQREFIRNKPGAGAGEVATDVMMSLPSMAIPGAQAPGFTGALTRMAGFGGYEGLTREGGVEERLGKAAAGFLGAGAGELGARAIGAFAHPFKKNLEAVDEELIEIAKSYNIPLSAADVTRNKFLEVMDSVLDFLPFSSAKNTARKVEQRRIWQSKVMGLIGSGADNAKPKAMGEAMDGIGSVYAGVARDYPLKIDGRLAEDAMRLRQKYMGRIGPHSPVFDGYLNDLDRVIAARSDTIPGWKYLDLRSRMRDDIDNLKSSDKVAAKALGKLKLVLDRAFARGVPSEEAAKLFDADVKYLFLKRIEKSTDALTGDIIPSKLLKGGTRADPRRYIYGKGKQDLPNLARVGEYLFKPRIGESGTTPRRIVSDMLMHPFQAASTVAGSVVPTPWLAAKSMANPQGYFARGIPWLERQADPEGLLRALLSRGGAAKATGQ